MTKTDMQPQRTTQYTVLRSTLVSFCILLLIPSLLIGQSTDSIEPPGENRSGRPKPFLRDILEKHVQFSSIHASIFSYKPELGSLTDVLRSIGVSKIPTSLMPMFAVVIEHSPELDSQLEIGYWQMKLDIPPPTSATLSTTLIPISYQLIYRPKLLSEFLPIYFGWGIGFLGASFSGSAIDLFKQQGILFDGSSFDAAGYVTMGAEVFRWDNSISLNLELKRILKTVETTGTSPVSVILDGTAIGMGVKIRF